MKIITVPSVDMSQQRGRHQGSRLQWLKCSHHRDRGWRCSDRASIMVILIPFIQIYQLIHCSLGLGANVYVTSGDPRKIEKAIKLGAKGGVNYKSGTLHFVPFRCAHR